MSHSPAPPLSQSALPVIHKVIRAELFKTSSQLAQAECEEIGSIQQQLQTVAELLRGHANHEDQSFEAILRDYDPVFANIMEDEHLKLEADLERLLQSSQALDHITTVARQAPLQQLYLDWNRFVGQYLLHMDDEERRLFAVIREQMPPLSVISHSVASMEHEPRHHFVTNLKQVTTLSEQQHILGNPDADHTQVHNQNHKEPA